MTTIFACALPFHSLSTHERYTVHRPGHDSIQFRFYYCVCQKTAGVKGSFILPCEFFPREVPSLLELIAFPCPGIPAMGQRLSWKLECLVKNAMTLQIFVSPAKRDPGS